MVQSLIDSNAQRQVPFSSQSLRFKMEIKIIFSSSTVPNTERTQSRFTQELRKVRKIGQYQSYFKIFGKFNFSI